VATAVRVDCAHDGADSNGERAVDNVLVAGADGIERMRLTWHMRQGEECRVQKEWARPDRRG
jgi:hypothetical protein